MGMVASPSAISPTINSACKIQFNYITTSGLWGIPGLIRENWPYVLNTFLEDPLKQLVCEPNHILVKIVRRGWAQRRQSRAYRPRFLSAPSRCECWCDQSKRRNVPPLPPPSSSYRNSDVHGLASGQKPSQAKPKVLAWSWLWPGLDFLKAKANRPGHGFEHYFCKQLPPIIITLTVA